MRAYELRCARTRVTSIFPSADEAWEAAFAAFGHIGGFSVRPA